MNWFINVPIAHAIACGTCFLCCLGKWKQFELECALNFAQIARELALKKSVLPTLIESRNFLYLAVHAACS